MTRNSPGCAPLVSTGPRMTRQFSSSRSRAAGRACSSSSCPKPGPSRTASTWTCKPATPTRKPIGSPGLAPAFWPGTRSGSRWPTPKAMNSASSAPPRQERPSRRWLQPTHYLPRTASKQPGALDFDQFGTAYQSGDSLTRAGLERSIARTPALSSTTATQPAVARFRNDFMYWSRLPGWLSVEYRLPMATQPRPRRKSGTPSIACQDKGVQASFLPRRSTSPSEV
jgi:hypothetical protein